MVDGISAEDIAAVFGPQETPAEVVEKVEETAQPSEESEKAEPVKAESSEEPKSVEDEKSAKRIIANKKFEAKLARERAAIQAELAKLETERKRVEEFHDRFSKLKEKPIEALRDLGMNPEEFMRRVIDDGKPNLEREFGDLRTEVQRLREEREAYLKSQKEAEAKAQQEQVTQVFVNTVNENYEKYPTLVEDFTDSEIAKMGLDFANTYALQYNNEYGEVMPDDFIAERLEAYAKARREQREARLSKFKKVETPAVGQKVSGPNKPQTLTNKTSAQRVSAPEPWSQEAADEESLRALEKAGFRR